MNKKTLIEETARNAGCTMKDARDAINACLAAITEAIKAGESVMIRGFGKFEPKQISTRVRNDFITGEPIQEPPVNTMKFKPADTVKEQLKR